MRLSPVSALLLPAFLLPLAACSADPSATAGNAASNETSASAAAPAVATGDGVMVQPGRWEGTMTIDQMDIPGVPAAVKEQMKAQMGGNQAFVSCVTEEDVKEQKAFFTGDRTQEGNCKYDRFDMAGGRIDAAMRCDGAEGGNLAMTMSGTYDAAQYRMAMDTRTAGVDGVGAMTMKMRVEAKRVGACTGASDEQ